MQLRYAFRLYPEPGQRAALARAFGCARGGVQRRGAGP
ncbi:helix-turn-helix domain-containing protein [Streptomyces sp. NPDC060053]